MSGQVTIINWNQNAHSMISSAGRISTTKGSADEIYQSSLQNAKEANIKLINKIIASGHESVLEHVFVNLSFDNVSVFVEQFMIEFRLASFTVKSRRYVDFGEAGYVLPDFTKYGEEDIKELYQNHMEYLFNEYNYLVGQGVPKEDARFVLPYSFKSNFYCTVNARELKKIMREMVYGRGKDLPELAELGKSLCGQCAEILPYLNIKEEEIKEKFEFLNKNEKAVGNAQGEDLVTFICGTECPENLICRAAALENGVAISEDLDAEQQKHIIRQIMQGTRKRELEQAAFTFLFHKISLAGVTHLVRHRMQSIVIPKYLNVCSFDNYVLPDSIVKCGLAERYKEVFAKSKKMAKLLEEKGFCGQERVYLLLSGMTIPIMTTMNGNELSVFMKLRTCSRAQWEIKTNADALLKILREKYPVLFSLYGPSCYTAGACPEGRMTCGKMQEVCRHYEMKSENECN